jgi:SAM-dependent methyltransferase
VTPETAPLDGAGFETLEVMREAPQYNAWQYSRIAPYVGRRVCEIGSGIGNMSARLLSTDREVAVLTDTDDYYLSVLRQTFASSPRVFVERLTLPDARAGERFRRYELDTVVALNVIEHIEDDAGAIRTIADLLRPGGRFVMLVPALPALHGTLDQELGHYRRYTARSVADRLRSGGFKVDRIFYFNLVGALGWWLNAKVLRRRRIPLRDLRRFDALVPLLRHEAHIRLPLGQSVIGVGTLL